MPRHILATGQTTCADVDGIPIDCAGTGQDAETAQGLGWGEDRFTVHNETVQDSLTGLTWLRDANAPGFPMTWDEAHAFIDDLNSHTHAGYDDWRLPDRRELFSLITFEHHSPALPNNHPFENLFQGWYWTNTPSAMHEAQVWHVHTMGGRMFWGNKSGYELVWPVRGSSAILPSVTSGEDNYLVPWPNPRFTQHNETVFDRLTELCWTHSANLAHGEVTWVEAYEKVRQLNAEQYAGISTWRLPTIRELESLTDAAHHTPALPKGHPFIETREAYWSATNSGYETNWAMCYYLHKGAVGVGYKRDRGFHVWCVTEKNKHP